MPEKRWAELPPELICRIGDCLDLKCYISARGACAAWRCALAPAFPSLLVVPDDDRCRPSAASIPTHRSFELKAIPFRSHCVGSSYGWLALSNIDGTESMFSLFNPIAATNIVLPLLIYSSRWAKSKLVFAPNPASDDFTAVVICDIDRLAYVTARAMRWAILDPVRLARGDQLADIVYHDEKGRVYCLTRHGDVHVLRLPKGRRREPIMADNLSSLPAIPPSLPAPANHSRSLGPDLNAAAKVEPLQFFPFDPATNFAPPYSTISAFTGANITSKHNGDKQYIWDLHRSS